MPDCFFIHEGINFVWDDNKNKLNVQKHGISFETAVHIFNDGMRLEFEDEQHSTKDEARFNTIGLAHDILTVVYTERYNIWTKTDDIRIISARKATKTEREAYNNNVLGR